MKRRLRTWMIGPSCTRTGIMQHTRAHLHDAACWRTMTAEARFYRREVSLRTVQALGYEACKKCSKRHDKA